MVISLTLSPPPSAAATPNAIRQSSCIKGKVSGKCFNHLLIDTSKKYMCQS